MVVVPLFFVVLLALGYCQHDAHLIRFEKEGCAYGFVEIRINSAYQDASGHRKVAHYTAPSGALTELTCQEKFLQAKKAHLSFTFGQDVLQLDFSIPGVSGNTISLIKANYSYLQDSNRFYMTSQEVRKTVVKSYPVNEMKFGEWKKAYSCSGRLLDLGEGVNIELLNMRLALFNADSRKADVTCPTPYIATTPVPQISHTTRDFSGIGGRTRIPSFRTTPIPSDWRATSTSLYPRLTTRDWLQPRTTRDWFQQRTTEDSWDYDPSTTRYPRYTTWHQQRSTQPWDAEVTTRYPRYTTRDWHIGRLSTHRPWMHTTTEDPYVDPITIGDYDSWGRRTTRESNRWTSTRDWRRRTTPDDESGEAAVQSNWDETTPRYQRYTTNRRQNPNVMTTWAPLKK